MLKRRSLRRGLSEKDVIEVSQSDEKIPVPDKKKKRRGFISN